MKKTLCLLFVAWAGAAVGAYAQETPSKTALANPITASEKGAYGYISGVVVAAAERLAKVAGLRIVFTSSWS